MTLIWGGDAIEPTGACPVDAGRGWDAGQEETHVACAESKEEESQGTRVGGEEGLHREEDTCPVRFTPVRVTRPPRGPSTCKV